MGLLITACTNRKRLPALAALRASALTSGNVETVAAEWVRRLASSEDRIPAQRLYAGRGFMEAVHASAALGGKFAIISAGLGLVTSGTGVPPYSLSMIEGSSDSILPKLDPRVAPHAWWSAACRASPFATSFVKLIRGSSGVILVALSEAYLSMIAPDLLRLEVADLQRFRLVTRTPQERVVPEIRPYLMPYDDRLDGPDSTIRGTRGDFATRAARHFVETVLKKNPGGVIEDHFLAVRTALAGWREPPTFERARYDDEQLLAIISEHWDYAGGRSTRLLRVLRDDLNIACEQGRFAGLMRRLRQERQAIA